MLDEGQAHSIVVICSSLTIGKGNYLIRCLLCIGFPPQVFLIHICLLSLWNACLFYCFLAIYAYDVVVFILTRNGLGGHLTLLPSYFKEKDMRYLLFQIQNPQHIFFNRYPWTFNWFIF